MTFDELAVAYQEAAEGLVTGGADLLVIETIFDTLNAKAAIFGVEAAFDALGDRVPLDHLRARSRMRRGGPSRDRPSRRSGPRSGTPGRSRSASTARSAPASCGATSPTSAGSPGSPSAPTRTPDCPNEFGGYDEQPATTAELLGQYARDGLVNIAGGCCGTTPAHVRAIVEAVAGVPPREIPVIEPATRLSGLQAVTIPSRGASSSTWASGRT